MRDYRLNVLRLHDDLNSGNPTYAAALAAKGYNAAGLYPNVTVDGKPILCAACHGSEALGAGSFPGVTPLTQAVHSLHAGVVDPTNGMTLNASANRSACYRCHPGLRDQVPARRHGQLRRRRREHGHAVPELPRPHERRGLRDPHRVAQRTQLPELPHGNGGEQQRPDPVHLRPRGRRHSPGSR